MADPPSSIKKQQSTIVTLLAWSVHLYTALGLVAAAGIAILLAAEHPTANSFRWAFLLMLVATLIDSTDGTLARLIRVKEVLPGFDGRRLDDLIDFLNYTCLPLLLIWRAELLPREQGWWLLLPLLASAYGFSQAAVKSADGYFLGFPSYWNVVAFYLYILKPPAWFALAVMLTLSLLTFVPSRYLYPSQRGRLNKLTNVLGAMWAVFLIWILCTLSLSEVGLSQANEGGTRRSALLSLLFPVYYLLASWVISYRIWLRARLAKKSGSLMLQRPG
jgi:phosphatidylcholine synthase